MCRPAMKNNKKQELLLLYEAVDVEGRARHRKRTRKASESKRKEIKRKCKRH